MEVSILEQIPEGVYWAVAIGAGVVALLGLAVNARLQGRRAAAAKKDTEVYQRTAGSFVRGLLGTPFAGAGVFVVILWLYQYWMPPEPWDLYLLYGVPMAAALGMLLATLFGETARFEIRKDGTLRYYKRKRLLQEWSLPQCQVGYYHKTVNGSDDTLRFTIVDKAGQEDTVDCEALGGSQFHRMFEYMQSFTGAKPVTLDAKAQ